MQHFKNGDLVVVRDDLTVDEKRVWPHFVLGMEPCVGHVYEVESRYGFNLVRSNEDQFAPDPYEWSWNESWCRPAFPMEDAEDADMAAVYNLV